MSYNYNYEQFTIRVIVKIASFPTDGGEGSYLYYAF